MQLEVLIIQDSLEVIHRSVSQVDDTVNPYTAAINAMVNELTGNTLPKYKQVLPKEDKFAAAVPNYVPPTTGSQETVQKPEPVQQELPMQFHPDLVKQGVAPTKGIPTIKLDMKSIMKDKKGT